MPAPEGLTTNQKKCLEAILRLMREKYAARKREISWQLGMKRDEVVKALRDLSSMGLVHCAPYDLITLTPIGKVMAADIVALQPAEAAFRKGDDLNSFSLRELSPIAGRR